MIIDPFLFDGPARPDPFFDGPHTGRAKTGRAGPFATPINHIPLKCDNTSAISLTKNPIMHSRTKHIEIRHHFLRDHINKGNCEIQYVDTKHQLADIFTKPLAKDRFYELRRELGILEIS